MNNYIIFANNKIVGKTYTVRANAIAYAQKIATAYPKSTIEVVAEDIQSGLIHTIALYDNGENVWN